MTEAKVLAHSVSSRNSNKELFTIEAVFPRIILAELTRHRVFSFSVASSRAIPVARAIQSIQENPFIPTKFPVNRPGMSATEYITKADGDLYTELVEEWLASRDHAIMHAGWFDRKGIHKQIVSRLLESFQYVSAIISGTEWDNFFELRLADDAQPEIQELAQAIKEAMSHSVPTKLHPGEWHIPLLTNDDAPLKLQQKLAVSCARVARTSYARQAEVKPLDNDITLYNRLVESKHWSPLEHCATPKTLDNENTANFQGWVQLRHHWIKNKRVPESESTG